MGRGDALHLKKHFQALSTEGKSLGNMSLVHSGFCTVSLERFFDPDEDVYCDTYCNDKHPFGQSQRGAIECLVHGWHIGEQQLESHHRTNTNKQPMVGKYAKCEHRISQ